MKLAWVLVVGALLSGCASKMADRDARQACGGYQEGTPAYADCYASVYPSLLGSRRAAMLGASASMNAAAQGVLATPAPRMTVTNCQGFNGTRWQCITP